MTHQHTRATATVLDLKEQHVVSDRHAGVLEQCPTLTHLDQRFCSNFDFGTVGTERMTEVLEQCRGLVTVNLNLIDNQIRAGGTAACRSVREVSSARSTQSHWTIRDIEVSISTHVVHSADSPQSLLC